MKPHKVWVGGTRQQIYAIMIVKTIKQNEFYLLRSIRLKTLVSFCFAIVFFTIFIDIVNQPKSGSSFYLNLTEVKSHIVDEKFLSLGLDTSVVASNFKGFNFTSPKLKSLISNLSPCYFRVGGNLADMLHFSVNGTDYRTREISYNAQNYTDFNMTATEWTNLNKFVSDVKVNLIFDLNALRRLQNGAWDSSNAKDLIKFSSDNDFKLYWELGNEPNSFYHKFNRSVNASQLGRDFVELRKILDQYETYKSSYLVGPDVTRPRTKDISMYLEKFLRAGARVLNAITWHHYYFNGRTATPEQFLDPETFDLLKIHIKRVLKVTRSLKLDDKPLWLGETATAWGGGARGLSDRFIASFIWLDKLGLSAKMGVSVVMRQSIFHEHYALLNDDYDPNPNYWVSILYKRLVGRTVITSQNDKNIEVRLYAHCAKKSSFNGTRPALVVFGVNVSPTEAIVKIGGVTSDPLVDSFELTSDSLFSRTVLLNGKPLLLASNHSLPDFKPKVIDLLMGDIVMPKYSCCFWIFRNVNVAACGTN